MRSVIFLGSNYNLNQMTDICEAQGLPVAGLVDSDYYGNTDTIGGVPVIGSENTFEFTDQYCYFLAVNWMPGDSNTRNRNKHAKFVELINDQNLDCVTLKHPTAIIPSTVTIGKNVLVGAYSVIGNYSIIGDFCQIREQSYLAHNSRLHTNVVVQVQSYVGANIQIGNNCYLAVKSSVITRGKSASLPAGTFIRANERCVL